MYKTAAGRYVVLLAGARDEMRAAQSFSYTFFTFSMPLARTRSRSLHRQGGGPGECQGPKAPCSFCPTEVTPAEGT